MREEAMLTGENEETWQEADETAIVFDNGGGQIVAGDLARDSTEGRESVDVTAGEGFEALAVVNSTYNIRLCASTSAKAYSFRMSPA